LLAKWQVDKMAQHQFKMKEDITEKLTDLQTTSNWWRGLQWSLEKGPIS